MEKRIQEKISMNPFGNLKESSIDDQLFQLKGVCLFGNRFSKNNREYSSNALDNLVNMAEGTKMHLNHISKDEKRNYGTRDIRTWGGIFSNPQRSGDKIHANLQCRESVYPLLKDIARLSPAGVGFSLDAMVKVSNTNGREVVESVEKLREFSLVSEGATISNLFEAIQDGVDKDIQEFIYGMTGNRPVDPEAARWWMEDSKRIDLKYQEALRKLEAGEEPEGKLLSRQEVKEAAEEFLRNIGSDTGTGGKKLSQKELDNLIDVFGVDA